MCAFTFTIMNNVYNNKINFYEYVFITTIFKHGKHDNPIILNDQLSFTLDIETP